MVVQEGYKETEIGVIPQDWKIKYLDEISDVIDPHPSHRAPAEVSIGIPFLGIGDFTEDGKLKKENYRVVSKIIFDEHKLRYNLNDELLGLGRVASIGKVVKFRNDIGEYTISPTLGILKPTNTTRDFLFQILKSESVIQYFSKIMSGSTRSSVGMIVLRKIPVPVPPLAEQTAIATALSDIDGLITGLEKLIAKKRNIKQGTMQQLLQPKEGWEVKKLGEIAEVRDGTHQTPKYVESGIPFYSVESVTNNNFTKTKFITKEEHALLTKTFKMEKGDILMTRIGSIGDCKLIDWDVDASFYVSLALLKIKKEFSAKYICHYSKSSSFIKETELNSLQSAIPRKINLGPISNIKIELPSLEEQIRIATILSDLDAELTALEQKLEKYKKIKLGMMQELLTGRTRLV